MNFVRSIGRLAHSFRRDVGGNIAVNFAIALIPILEAVGCAVDYSMAVRIRAKLQSAADSGSVAAVSLNSAGYTAALAMTSDGPVPAGATEATNIFTGNVTSFSGSYNNLNVTSTVNKSGTSLTSNVAFNAQVPTIFMSIVGFKALTISGSSTATAATPLYMDFYLTLDVSGSMGLPSTTSEANRMQAINPDNYQQYPTGCTLACHFATQNDACSDSGTQGYPTNNYCLGYAISRVSQSGYRRLLKSNRSNPMGVQLPSSVVKGLPNSLYSTLATVSNCPTDGTDSCIQLRLDAVGSAVNQLFRTANQTEKMPGQFRIGLYPFIQNLYSYFPLTTNINGSATNPSTINYAAANLASLLDTNMDTNLGSGGTHIDTALSSINGLIMNVGSGHAWNDTLPYVFLVTDGAQDNQIKGVPNGWWSGSNQATVIDPTRDCAPLKKRGIVVSVLYIPYQPISPVNQWFAGDEDDYANNNIASIPPSLKGCASPGFFYTANTPADITAALNAMFTQAVATARIAK